MLGGLGWGAWFAVKAYPVLWWPAAALVLALLFVDLPALCDFCDSPIERSKRVWRIGFKKNTACPECHRHIEGQKRQRPLPAEAADEGEQESPVGNPARPQSWGSSLGLD